MRIIDLFIAFLPAPLDNSFNAEEGAALGEVLRLTKPTFS
jgi:hypothetical protein